MPGAAVVRGGVVDRPTDPVRHVGVRFEGTRFVGLSGMRGWVSFEACELVECEFVDCDVDTVFAGALAHPESASTLVRTRFERCRLGGAYLGGVRLEACVFDDCDFAGTRWDSLDLVGCVFRGVVSGLTVSASSGPISRPPPFNREKLPPRHNVVDDNDFTDADLRGLGLRGGVPVERQHWPLGEEYVVLDRLPERIAQALDSLVGEDDGGSRTLRAMLANQARTGQDSGIFRLDDPVMPDTHLRMVRLLVASAPGGTTV